MKRLFAVKNGRNQLVDDPKTGSPWFGNKMDAKAFRDTLSELPPYRITRGPDHIGPHGQMRKGWKKR